MATKRKVSGSSKKRLVKNSKVRLAAIRDHRKKLLITLMSVMATVCFLAVGVLASARSFSIEVANVLDIALENVEGTLLANRTGGVVYNADLNEDPVVATDISDSVIYQTETGVNSDNLSVIQQQVNVNKDNNYITYVFEFTRDENAVLDTYIYLVDSTDLALENNSKVTISYKYDQFSSRTATEGSYANTIIPYDTSAETGTILCVNSSMQKLFIEAKLELDVSDDVKIDEVYWRFEVFFDINNPILNPPVATVVENDLMISEIPDAVSYNVYAIDNSDLNAVNLNYSALGDEHPIYGTLIANITDLTSPYVLSANEYLELGKSYTINVAGVKSNGSVGAVSKATENYQVPSYNILVTDNGGTLSNSATAVKQGGSYTANVTFTHSGDQSVVVMMGGVDVTSTAYNSGTKAINIASVTGNLEITVSSVSNDVTFTITSNDISSSSSYGGDISVVNPSTATKENVDDYVG